MNSFLRTFLGVLLSVWIGGALSQDVYIAGDPKKKPGNPVLIKRQGPSPVLIVRFKASDADTEAQELHRQILAALYKVYEERVFPLKREGDSRIQQSIRCDVIVTGGPLGSSFEARCGRRFPREIFVGLADSGIATSEFGSVAGRIPQMLDEMYGLALQLPE